jgi:hypothetical protein
MSEKELAELLKFSKNDEIYIINKLNQLKRLKCPFIVIAIKDIGTIKKHQKVYVDQVKVNLELITIYIIKSKAYFYFNFTIVDP